MSACLISDLVKRLKKFYSSKPMTAANISETRDFFQARLDSFYKFLTKKGVSFEEASLISAVVGEIGNNCFDHNLGQWNDKVGAYFDFMLTDKIVVFVIADNGTGVFKSLKRVVPDLKSDMEALKIAFEKKISGRAPEKRGNGLKFVRGIINGSKNKSLVCFSGQGKIQLGGDTTSQIPSTLDHEVQGVCTFVSWRFS